MTETGWIQSYDDGTFRPAAQITAGQFVTIVARCAGLEPIKASSSHWAAGRLAAALQAGASPGGPWSASDLAESGRFVFSRFR